MSRGRRRLLIFFTLSLVALIVMTYQYDARSFAPFRMLSYPFDLLNSVTARVADTARDWASAFEENRRLRAELTTALVENQRYREIAEENKRLRDMLSLRADTPRYLAVARVIARGYDRFLNTIVIDKGEDAGIKKGMAVITTKGLAGKISLVRGDFSEVLLLTDPNFSVAVRLQESRAEGVIAGTGEDDCLLKYIPAEVKVQKEETVVTSGLDGVFPSGIPVGEVSLVREKGGGFFQEVHVTPFQQDMTIEEVLVLQRTVAVPPSEGKRHMRDSLEE